MFDKVLGGRALRNIAWSPKHWQAKWLEPKTLATKVASDQNIGKQSAQWAKHCYCGALLNIEDVELLVIGVTGWVVATVILLNL